jgi:hypothetical protein
MQRAHVLISKGVNSLAKLNALEKDAKDSDGEVQNVSVMYTK